MRRSLGRDCPSYPENVLTSEWKMAYFGAIVDVNLFLVIKNKFISKIAHHLKFTPTFLGEAIAPIAPSVNPPC